jgi:hypothetical protein
MKKIIVVSIAVFALVLGVSRPVAATPTNAVVTVGALRTTGINEVAVQFSDKICTDTTNGPDWGVASTANTPTTADGVKAMLSTLTAAKLSGKKVMVGTQGAATGGTWACQIAYVQMQ